MKIIQHYIHDSANPEWLEEMRRMCAEDDIDTALELLAEQIRLGKERHRHLRMADEAHETEQRHLRIVAQISARMAAIGRIVK